ncbi:hypothetical protein [Singulisphaera sp. PoT]|uniref:hypothetical protein n=1 Tax=Singulisphaera sp. PoT TaxID=3411797 RepID=UPI003BF5219F
MTDTNAPAGRRRRRLKIAGLVFVVGLVAIAAAIPWLLGTPPVRRWLIVRANRVLAPGEIQFRSIRFSWFGPTRLAGFQIRNDRKVPVVACSTATWDRNLWQILFDRPRYGTLHLDHPDLRVERRLNGDVDLYEAIKPILSKNPKVDLHVRVIDGKLRFQDDSQATPVVAERVNLKLDIPSAPNPLSWDLQLKNAGNPRAAKLDLKGRYERWKVESDGSSLLAIDARGDAWTWTYGTPELAFSGIFGGELAVRSELGRWQLDGKLGMDAVEASGSMLAGDRPRFGTIAAELHAKETSQGWDIGQFDVRSPIVQVRAKSAPSVGSQLEGSIDLAALLRELPHRLHVREGVVLDKGNATFSASSKAERGVQAWDIEARISDLEARDHDRALTLKEPATVSARLRPTGTSWGLDRLAARTKSLDIQGTGDLENGIELSGNIDIQAFLGEFREILAINSPGLSGKGSFQGKYRRDGKGYQATLDAKLQQLGLGSEANGFHREAAQVQVAIQGLSGSLGFPESWSSLQLGLASGDITGNCVVESRDGKREINGSARFPLATNRQGDAKLDAHWDSQGLAIEQVDIGLTPSGPDAADAPPRLTARGQLDLTKGELTLFPADDVKGPRAIALGEDGLRVTGLGGEGSPRGTLTLVGDVASVVRSLADPNDSPLAGLSGEWSAQVSLETEAKASRLAARVDVLNLGRRVEGEVQRTVEGPIRLALNADYAHASDQLEIPELSLASTYGSVQGSGKILELGGEQKVDLRGSLLPNWEKLTELASQRIEPGAKATGKASPWSLQGSFQDARGEDPFRTIAAKVGVSIEELDIYGLHTGPTELALEAAGGKLKVAPIDTSLNGGRVHLEPGILIDPNDGVVLRLGDNSSIEDAEINEEVSRRFLSYVAPILDRATRAKGSVSVDVKDAYLPLDPRAKRATSVDGAVVFQDVEFTPGPFVDTLFDIVGREERPTIKLNDPVSLTIADHRVYQQGLAFPLGKLTEVRLEGWVDFDRNIEMKASVPLTTAMVGNRPLLGNIVGGTRIQVPIRGTLSKPVVDRDAMNFALKDLGKTLLERSAVQGAAAILERLTKGRDPNAPPPLTPQERKAQRQERREERKKARQRP